MQQEFLRAPELNLGSEQHVRIAAIDLMQAAELTQLLTRLAELAEYSPVQLHFVDFAGNAGQRVVVGIGESVRGVQELMRTRSDAEFPGRADIVVNSLELQVVIENL